MSSGGRIASPGCSSTTRRSPAAGHRPCAACRRESYNAYREAWADGLGEPPPSAAAIDARLHAERIVRGTHRRRVHPVAWHELPTGAFVFTADGAAAIVLDDCLVTWTPEGYDMRLARPVGGTAETVTPPSSLAVLRAGYPVQIDAAARSVGPDV